MKSILKKIVVFILITEARIVLRKYSPMIIGVTGSVGKTSTKDAIATVLSPNYNVRKSDKSFNSEIGVPLTILGLSNAWNNPFQWLYRMYEGLIMCLFPHHYPEVLVLEIGADRRGDIEKITRWLKPDIAVFTKVGEKPVHIEFFNDVDEVVKEKANIIQALKPTGLLVYCNDDARVRVLGEAYVGRSVSFGCDEGSTYQAHNIGNIYDQSGKLAGFECSVSKDEDSTYVSLHGVLGRGHAYAVSAALAVADDMRIAQKTAGLTLSSHSTPPGRMRILDGIKNTILIDDTYNASPIATEEALKTLSTVRTSGKRIAVLGDMLELGALANEAHKSIGTLVAASADVLVGVGVRAKWYVEGALNGGMSEKKTYHFDDSIVAGKFLEGILDPGDVALIKGSQSMRMERTVEEVMADPQKASELLVRQENEWEKR